MAISTTFAGWFLILTLPFCLWAAWADMKSMKIPNRVTDGLLAVYVLGGAALVLWGGIADWGWSDYFWRFSHFIVILLVGMGMNALRLMGAGDAKFLASAAPFIALPDIGAILMIYLAALVVTFIGHRTARATAIRDLAPDWASWAPGKRFPMGLAFGVTLSLYFLLGWLGLPAL